ncbi:MAG TPA: adenylate/guanylate cyclase domain-containing protein [Chitinophagaceae bacterium]
MSSHPKKSFWIEFIGDRSLRIEERQTILAASLAAGVPHYHACGGKAECSTCRVLVESGSEHLTPFNHRESALRARIPLPSNVRLACQTYVTGGPVHLHRIIRDENDIRMYVEDEVLGANEVQLGAEQELALFFLDIRDFTPFMEAYLPFDVIHIMRRLFTLFRKSIEEQGGCIVETAGDGLYAVFGLKEGMGIPASAQAAVAAGSCILQRLEEFNEAYLERHFNHRFEVGIGIHAGKVIVGNIGIGVNNNLTVMGLPVVIAARLQGATRKLDNSMVVSDEVYRLLELPDEVPGTEMPLKGMVQGVKVHLLGKKFTS